mgnify:FL=1
MTLQDWNRNITYVLMKFTQNADGRISEVIWKSNDVFLREREHTMTWCHVPDDPCKDELLEPLAQNMTDIIAPSKPAIGPQEPAFKPSPIEMGPGQIPEDVNPKSRKCHTMLSCLHRCLNLERTRSSSALIV